MLPCKLQVEVEEQRLELQQYNLKAQENNKASEDLLEPKNRNEALDFELVQLRKDVLDGTFASTFREGEGQAIYEKVDALNFKLYSAKGEVVALRLDVDVI